MLRTAADAFPKEAGRIYRSVVIPAGLDKGGMERFDLGVRPFTRGSTLWDDAFSRLRAEERYLDSLAPSLLASNHFQVWPRDAAYMSTQRLWDAFVQFPHLPMLAGKPVLVDAITAAATTVCLATLPATPKGRRSRPAASVPTIASCTSRSPRRRGCSKPTTRVSRSCRTRR